MVSWRQINLGIDGLIIAFTQARLSMGSDVRDSVLKATPKKLTRCRLLHRDIEEHDRLALAQKGA